MHIILVSSRLATTRSITLDGRHLLMLATSFVFLVLLTSSLFSWLTVRHAVEWRLPFVEEMMGMRKTDEARRSNEFVRENLNAMATRLGQLQAQLMRLDLLGERLAASAGIRAGTGYAGPGKANDKILDKDARGGPLVQARPLTQAELLEALDQFSRQVESRSDALALIESQLFDERMRKNRLPTALPVAGQWSSNFGWRIDPFTGEKALHEGVDFPAETGTPVNAAAGGVILTAETHPEYGNMIEIDHGDGLSTRYAHLSKMLVKPGMLVRRNQPIGEIGTTGRSTGPHLHFEVRLNGSAQNPGRFLQYANARNPQTSLAAHR